MAEAFEELEVVVARAPVLPPLVPGAEPVVRRILRDGLVAFGNWLSSQPPDAVAPGADPETLVDRFLKEAGL